MRTIKIILALTGLYTGSVQAQFFGQMLYTRLVNSRLIVSAAEVTNIHSTGFLTTSYDDAMLLNAKPFFFRKTNQNGGFSSSKDFFTGMKVYRNVNCSSNQNYSQPKKCYGASCIETGNSGTSAGGSNYAFAAACGGDDSTGYFCVFGTLSVAGNVVNKAFYPFPANTNYATKAFITESVASPGTYYICGSYTDGVVGVTYAYIICVNVNGAVSWSKVYDCSRDLVPNGILESPYNPAELVVIGRSVFSQLFAPNLPLAEEGFFLNVDAANGNVNIFNVYGDDLPLITCNEFYSLNIANSGFGGSSGYIIGGKSDQLQGNPGYGGGWMIKLDPSGNIIWTTLLGALSSFRISSVMERLNNSGNYEYYGADMSTYPTVYKLDDSGTLLTGTPNKFEYTGITLNSTCPVFLTQLNSSSSTASGNNGLQLYTTDPSILEDDYFVKAYFDGISGCSTDHTNETQGPGPSQVVAPGISASAGLVQGTCIKFDVFNAFLYAADSISYFCSYTSIGGASNSRQVTGIEKNTNSDRKYAITPNPVSDKAILNFQSAYSDHIKIELRNNLGQVIKTVYDLKNSEHPASVEIDFTSLNLAGGIYFLHTTINSKSEVEKVIYEK